MYNHRLILAGLKEDLIAIIKAAGVDPLTYNKRNEFEEKFGQPYLRLAVWLDVREIVPDEYVAAIDKNKNKIKLDVASKYVSVNGRRFFDVLEFTEYIHANYPLTELKYMSKSVNSDIEKVPVLVGDGIKIYEVNNPSDAISLVGNDTSWCIGRSGPENMWQAYRKKQESTFFIVFDDNPPTPEQRKVAIDFAKNEIQLTDIPNRTGSQLSNDWSVDEYFKYLKSKGIDLTSKRVNPKTGEEEKILQNKPVSMAEKLENNILKTNLDLKTLKNWLNGIANATIYSERKSSIYGDDYNSEDEMFVYIEENFEVIGNLYDNSIRSWIYTIRYPEAPLLLSKYIDTGKILDDEVFDFVLSSSGGVDILKKYVNTGLNLPVSQLEKIENNKELLNSYVRKQLIVGETQTDLMDKNIFKYLNPENSEDVQKVKKVFESLSNRQIRLEKLDNLNWFKVPEFFSYIHPNDVFRLYGIENLRDIEKKIYIANKFTTVYKENPTVETTKILFGFPKEIQELLEEAKKQRYASPLFYNIIPELRGQDVNVVPDEILKLPEFREFYNVKRLCNWKKLSDEEKIEPDIVKYRLTMEPLVDPKDRTYVKYGDKDFWLDFISNYVENYELLSKIFKANYHFPSKAEPVQVILKNMPDEFLYDEEIIYKIFTSANGKPERFYPTIGSDNLLKRKLSMLDPKTNDAIRNALKKIFLSGNNSAGTREPINYFLRILYFLIQDFGSSVSEVFDDVKKEFIVQNSDNYFILKSNPEHLKITLEDTLLYLDTFGNDEQAVNKMPLYNLYDGQGKFPLVLQQKIKSIPILFNRFKDKYWFLIPDVMDETSRYKLNKENETTTASYRDLIKIASALDSKKKYKDSDLVLNYIKRYSNV